MNIQQLTGLDDKDIVVFESDEAWISTGFLIHKKLKEPLHELCFETHKQGLKLALLSGYRNYQRQCQIWKAKIQGNKAILDSHGIPCDLFSTEDKKFEAIARWSAIPGTSRHHWGTDIDIFSATAIENNYKVELTQKEFQNGGPCYELELWLSENIEIFDFFRPYSIDSGGIAPEPWHLSFKPLASKFTQQFSQEYLISIWQQHPWSASNWAIDNGKELFKRFVELGSEERQNS